MTRPFVIWTLQRTGGTNLAKAFIERSGLPGTDGVRLATEGPLSGLVDSWGPHEPFNLGDPNRAFNGISEAFKASGDLSALDRAVETIAHAGVPAKHCVEMVPWPISDAFARATMRADYRHVILHRRDLLARVLSRQFAERSGIWGPNMHRDDVSAVFEDALPVGPVVEHELHSARRMRQIWELLASGGSPAFVVAFEDLYEAPSDTTARATVKALAAHLNLFRDDAPDEAFVDEVLRYGDQGTRASYDRFPNIAEVREALEVVEKFDTVPSAARVAVDRLAKPSWVCTAYVDVLPEPRPETDELALGGVIVVRDAPQGATLHATVDGAPIGVDWGMNSARIAAIYPDADNASCARFQTHTFALPVGGTLRVDIRHGHERVTLIEAVRRR